MPSLVMRRSTGVTISLRIALGQEIDAAHHFERRHVDDVNDARDFAGHPQLPAVGRQGEAARYAIDDDRLLPALASRSMT